MAIFCLCINGHFIPSTLLNASATRTDADGQICSRAINLIYILVSSMDGSIK